MAKGNNLLFKNFSGQIGKQIVIKQYGNKTIIAAYPNMPKSKPTALKKLYESRFREAVKYAKEVMRSEALRTEYEMIIPKGRKLFNFIISAYLKRIKTEQGPKL